MNVCAWFLDLTVISGLFPREMNQNTYNWYIVCLERRRKREPWPELEQAPIKKKDETD